MDAADADSLSYRRVAGQAAVVNDNVPEDLIGEVMTQGPGTSSTCTYHNGKKQVRNVITSCIHALIKPSAIPQPIPGYSKIGLTLPPTGITANFRNPNPTLQHAHPVCLDPALRPGKSFTMPRQIPDDEIRPPNPYPHQSTQSGSNVKELVCIYEDRTLNDSTQTR